MAKLWDIYKSEIYTLYIADRRSLEDVQRILKGRHNFDASIRSYRNKLGEWNMKKGKVNGQDKRKHVINRKEKQRRTVMSNSAAQSNTSYPSDEHSTSGLPEEEGLPIADAWTEHMEISGTVSRAVNSASMSRAGDPGDTSTGNHSKGHLQSDPVSSTNLFNAILNEEEEEVLRLLSIGTSVHIRDGYDNTPLHAAILKGSITIAKSLLNYGANVDSRGYQNKTPFHMAIASRPLTELLLKHSPKLCLQDDEGNTALHYVLNTKDWWDNKDAAATIRTLISAGANINLTNNLGESPFHRAISDAIPKSYSFLELMFEFLDHNPDITLPMRNGADPFLVFLNQCDMFESSIYNAYKAVEMFLLAGADPNISFRSTPLLVKHLSKGDFIEGSSSERALLSLIQRANTDVTGPGGNHPLHITLGRRSDKQLFAIYAATTALIAKHADVNQSNDKGESPLEIWLGKRYYKRPKLSEVALLLVDAGADTMKLTSDGRSLFDMLGDYPSDVQNLLMKAFLKSGAVATMNRDTTNLRIEWIHIWHAAWKQLRWHDAKVLLGELLHCPSRPKAMRFQDCATVVLVEHQLEFHKSALKRWQENLLGKEVVVIHYDDYCAILRDCRERGITVDVSWYAFLLELMDFKNSGSES